MPEDVFLASLIEDTSNEVTLTYDDANSRRSNEIKMENLTPPELDEEWKKEFKAYFWAVMGDGKEISPSTGVLKKEGNNETEINSILKEHSYSKIISTVTV